MKAMLCKEFGLPESLVLEEVDGLVTSKLISARNELSHSAEQKVQTEVKKVLSIDKIEMEEKYAKLWKICFISLCFSLAAFGVIFLGNF